MTDNHKLTALLKGRSINSTSNANGAMIIGFDDGSTMTVKTADTGSNSASSGTIEKVQQEGTTLTLVMDGDSTMEIPLAKGTGSVIVENKDGEKTYAD